MWFPLLFCFVAVISSVTTSQYTHCSIYDEYKELHDLARNDNRCTDVKTMFKLLRNIHHIDGKPSCRIHIIRTLADHFGPNATTPSNCICDGKLELMPYHTNAHDGTFDHKDSCMKDHEAYRKLYDQFFQSSHSHAGNCRTHHSIWYDLDKINRDGDDNDGCQQDFMFHLVYSFDHHSDHCRCIEEVPISSTHHTTRPTTSTTRITTSTTRPTASTTRPTTTLTTNATHSTTGLTTQPPVHHNYHDATCLNFESFTNLVKLAADDGCLSANSVWHYLDDLQVKDPECRKIIQHYMSEKYKNNNSSTQDSGVCTCHEQRQLVGHKLPHLNNGTYGPCHKTEGTYANITAEFFLRIHEYGCQNHNVLWPKLEGINNFCHSHHHHHHHSGSCQSWTDCQQDLIVRAAMEYPTDMSDSCVCMKASATSITSSTTSHAFPTVTSSSIPTTTTQRMAPKLEFNCDKMQVIESVAGLIKTTHVNASHCVPDTGSSDDAVLLSWCNMTSPSTWRKGGNVMADCESSSPLIPTYTPISSFDSETYSAVGAQSGIFLGCYNSGIKMAIQKCNGLPEIVHVEHGAFQNNPRNYYVIETR